MPIPYPIQLVVGVLLVALFGVSVLLLRNAVGHSGWSLRRSLQGILLGATAIVLLLLWQSLQGEKSGARHVLVVYSDSLESQTESVQEAALQVLVSALPANSELAFVRLSANEPATPPNGLERLKFFPKSEALRGKWPKIAETTAHLSVLQPTDGEIDREGWLHAIVACAIANRSGFNPLDQPTVMLLYDHDRTWAALRVPKNPQKQGGEPLPPPWQQELENLTKSGVQLFVVDLQPEPGRRLEIFSTSDIWPIRRVAELPPMIGVRIPEAPTTRTDLRAWRVTAIRGSIDDRPARNADADAVGRSQLILADDGGAPYLTIHPSKVFPPDFKVEEGFHRLNLRVTIQLPNEPSPRFYEGTRYVRAEQPFVLLYSPRQALPRLTREGWMPAPLVAFPLFLTQKLRENEFVNRPRLQSIGLLKTKGPSALDTLITYPHQSQEDAGLRAAQLEALRTSRAVIILEPTHAELETLSRQLDLDTAIRKGLNVLVIGPPPTDPSHKAPEWLPATTIRARDDQPLLAFRDPRLYIVPDNSRITQLPTSVDDLRSLQDVQEEIMGRIRKRLQAPPATSNRAGRVASGTETAGKIGDRVITIFPAVAVTSQQRNALDDYASGTSPAARLDLSPGNTSIRLRALAGGAGDGYFGQRGIRDGHLHPKTFVLLFNNELGHTETTPPRPLQLSTTGHPPVILPAMPPMTPEDLGAMGIRTFIVDLKVAQRYHGFFKPYSRPAPKPASAPQSVLPPALLKETPRPKTWTVETTDGESHLQSIADAVVHEMDLALSEGEGMGLMRAAQHGRSVDPRVAPTRSAPRLHAILEPQPQITFDGPVAVILDHQDSTHAIHQPLPGLVTRHYGEGHVLVLAFSPLAADLWHRDGAPDSLSKEDGWALQRLLDLIEVTSASRPLTDAPSVMEIRQLEDGSTLQIDAWTRSFATSDWRVPELELPNGQHEVLTVVTAEAASNRITLQARPASAVKGRVTLHLDPSPAAGPSTRASVYVDLDGKLEGARTVIETLRALAAFSGGATIDPLRDRDSEHTNAKRRLQNPLPISFLFGIILCGVILALLLPPVRPWTGPLLAWRRWRERMSRPTMLIPPAVIMDVDGILAEWGFQRGSPSAIRSAGSPAAEKLWDIGDDLAVARRSTLVPFTTLGKSMGLPPTRPTLRQRHITRAMDALIVVDNSRSILEPASTNGRSKSDLAPVLASLLARIIWMQAGSVSGVAARGGRDKAHWGPSTSDDDGPDLERWVQRCLRSGGDQLRVPDLLPGQIFFLISDLMAIEEDELKSLAVRCGRDGIELRVAHLVSPAEKDLTGLVWNVEAGVYHDRTQWEAADLSRALAERIERFRHLVEQAEGRFISLSIDSGPESIREELQKRGFLS